MNETHLRSTRLLCLGVLLALSALSGCSRDYFVCSANADCVQADGGQCEASGACSFPDPECPSGRRYGSEGNPQIAGTCVTESDTGSTGLSGLPGDDTTSSTSTLATESAEGTSSESSSGLGPMTSEGTNLTEASSTSSDGGESSTSTGVDIPVRELYQPCSLATGEVDCPNSWCAEFVVGVAGGFCTIPCADDSECYDPGTGASAECRVTLVEGTDGGSCMLECSESGVDGCLDGMSCTPQAMLPDGSQARICFHPA